MVVLFRSETMKSMTGFGIAEGIVGKGRLFVEVKSVNHRYCEIFLKLPNKMGSIEGHVRRVLQKKFLRGKVEIFMREKMPLFGGVELKIDAQLAQSYHKAFQQLERSLGEKGNHFFLDYMNADRFITATEREGSYETYWKQIQQLVTQAANHVDRMRMNEGKHLRSDQQKRLKLFEKLVKQIERRSLNAVGKHAQRIKQRMEANGSSIDTVRLHTEATLLGGRQDIAEEVTRLMSHLKQYGKLFSESGAVGRKLDFLLQEMNREINTIGAKAADIEISRLVVDCKAELERLREQVQNIE